MNYDALGQDAQAQGQARTADYTNKANQFGGDYANYQNQANAANQNIQNQNAYMQGAGSANNLYSNAFNTQAGQTGYDQKALQAAQAGLTNAVGTQSAFNDFANQAASKWGLNAGGLAAANAGATQGLNNNIASQGGALAAQQKAFEQAQTGANQQTGLGLQQQQTQLQGYQNAFDAATSQQKTAQDNLQFYENLAQQQGGLTAQQVQGYQQSKALSAAAQASLASASLAIAQAKQTEYQMGAQQAADAKARQDATANNASTSGSFTPDSAKAILANGVSSPQMKTAAQQYLSSNIGQGLSNPIPTQSNNSPINTNSLNSLLGSLGNIFSTGTSAVGNWLSR